jgi:integrase
MGQLTTLKVRNAGPGRHGDGDGLYLLVKPSGARSWLLRVQQGGKRRDIGLGSVDLGNRGPGERRASDDIPLLLRRSLSLQQAREKAAELRRFARAGIDPVSERDRERRRVPTFEEAAQECHKELKASWTQRQADTFLSSLQRHAFPKLGKLQVDRVEASDVRDMLAPIWGIYSDMSRKVKGRVGQVLNYSHSKGWRPSEAPGRSVTMGLGKRAPSSNLAAMEYADVPKFVAGLNGKEDTMGRLALLFVIVTAARSGEVRNARWSHVDPEKKLWRRPAELMKGRTAHVVTLSEAALDVLERAAALCSPQPDDLIFSMGQRALSDMTLTKVMRDAELPYTVHGFRSSFRDWAAEKVPEIPDAVAEAALAHVVPDKVIRAYKRTDFLEMRSKLLQAWGTFAYSTAEKKRP